MTSSRPFLVHAGQLRTAVGARSKQVRQGAIEGLDCSGSAVPERELPVADVVIESVLGGVSVSGTVRA